MQSGCRDRHSDRGARRIGKSVISGMTDAVKRDAKGKWLAGVSPNPGGRRVTEREVVLLARSAGVKATRRLIELINSPDERVAIIAANSVLDRAYGKAREHVNLEITDQRTENGDRDFIAQQLDRQAAAIIEAETPRESDTGRMH